MPADTIFALSSGRPPAAIAVIRISGPAAASGLEILSSLPAPRRATVATLRHPATRETLDNALILWMPGPNSVTGEDVVELHLHGGRAVVDAVLGALATLPNHRQAEPGEFTRRAFESGRIDLNEAEGLADLLAAETDAQRRAAMLAAGGAFSRRVDEWRGRLLAIAAAVEAAIDYGDELDDDGRAATLAAEKASLLACEIRNALGAPRAERLKDGIRVVFAGPPNAGKSTLINALAGREAAIVAAIAGTTRDVIEVPLILGGVPVILIDTAGLHDAADAIEAEGVVRASQQIATGDILIWLGADAAPLHDNVIAVSPQADRWPVDEDRMAVSAHNGLNLHALRDRIVSTARTLLPPEGAVALNNRQAELAQKLAVSLNDMAATSDVVIQAEELRKTLEICDRFAGRSGVEDMLDALFRTFCLGK